MFGEGESWGALTVVNALATGGGAALGVNLKTTVKVSSERREGWAPIRPKASLGDLLSSVYEEFCYKMGVRPFELFASVETQLPSGVGMKSSSSVANALILALADAYNLKIEHSEVLSINTSASLKAGVSRTGALDDAAACLLGGVEVTDNLAGKILASYEAKREKAVFLIPHNAVRPSLNIRFGHLVRSVVETAHGLALRGRYHEALNLNGSVYAHAYGYDNTPIVEAWRIGASAAGITGNGPAYAALVEESMLEELCARWSAHGRLIVSETRNPEGGFRLGRGV